jgi:hypothetical protein
MSPLFSFAELPAPRPSSSNLDFLLEFDPVFSTTSLPVVAGTSCAGSGAVGLSPAAPDSP